MKLLKSEKLWIAAVATFFVLYNLPGVPAYGDARGLLIHALVTVLPLWIAVYVGLEKMGKVWQLRDEEQKSEIKQKSEIVENTKEPEKTKRVDAGPLCESCAEDA
jgi:hypothetical protein